MKPSRLKVLAYRIVGCLHLLRRFKQALALGAFENMIVDCKELFRGSSPAAICVNLSI
jgi:hypothetical protein